MLSSGKTFEIISQNLSNLTGLLKTQIKTTTTTAAPMTVWKKKNSSHTSIEKHFNWISYSMHLQNITMQ